MSKLNSTPYIRPFQGFHSPIQQQKAPAQQSVRTHQTEVFEVQSRQQQQANQHHLSGLSQASSVSEVSPTSAQSISMDPMALLGNVHNGVVKARIPLDPELLPARKLLSVKDGAHVDVSFVVKNGKIDFEKTKVSIDEVHLLGKNSPFELQGLYFNNKGKLKAKIKGAPNIGLTKAIFGERRAPRSLDKAIQAIQEKGEQRAQRARRRGKQGQPRISLNDVMPSLEKGFSFSAENISFAPNKKISLGGDNHLNFSPSTKLSLSGNLHEAELKGNVSVNDLALRHEDHSIALGKSDVAFEATVTRQDRTLQTSLELKGTELNVDELRSTTKDGTSVQLQEGKLSLGKVKSNITADLNGTIHDFDLKASGAFDVKEAFLSDEHMSVTGATASIERFDMDVKKEDGKWEVSSLEIDDFDGKIEKLTIRDESGKELSVQQGQVENLSFSRKERPDGSIEQQGSIGYLHAEIDGEVQADFAPIQGNIRADNTVIDGSFAYSKDNIEADFTLRSDKLQATQTSINFAGNKIHLEKMDAKMDMDVTIQDRDNFHLSNSSGSVSAELGDTLFKLGRFGELEIQAGSKAEFELASASIGNELEQGSFLGKGTMSGGIERGKVRLGSSSEIELKGGQFDLNIKHVEKKEGEALPDFIGDLKLDVGLEGEALQSLANSPYISKVDGVSGQVSLDLKNARLQGNGEVKIDQANVQLQASVDTVEGKLDLPNLKTGAGNRHIVQPGDTIDKISKDLGINPGFLRYRNGFSPTHEIRPGQEIWVPKTKARSYARQQVSTRIDTEMPKTEKALLSKVSPIGMASTIEDGQMELTLPLHADGIESLLPRILRDRVINVPEDSALKASLCIKGGEIDYENSSFELDPPLEGMGLELGNPITIRDDKLLLDLPMTDRGDLNLTPLLLGKNRLPTTIRKLSSSLTSRGNQLQEALQFSEPQESNSTLSPRDALSQVSRFVRLDQVTIKADGVTMKDGSKIPLGEGNFVTLGESNKISLSGSAQELQVSGRLEAGTSKVNLGNVAIAIDEGKLHFDSTIRTGISSDGKFTEHPMIETTLNIPEARIRQLNLNHDSGHHFEMRQSTVKGLTLQATQAFQNDDGKLTKDEKSSKFSLHIPEFEGLVSNTHIEVKNEGKEDSEFKVDLSQVQGEVKILESGRMTMDFQLDETVASINNLDLPMGGTMFQGLDTSIEGSGRMKVDTWDGIELEGKFRAKASVEEGVIDINGTTKLDLKDNSSFDMNLSYFDFRQDQVPRIRGDFSMNTGLDAGSFKLPSGQTLQYDNHSEIELTAQMDYDQQGQFIDLQSQASFQLDKSQLQMNHKNIQADLDIQDGILQYDLGNARFHEDGRFTIENTSIDLQTQVKPTFQIPIRG